MRQRAFNLAIFVIIVVLSMIAADCTRNLARAETGEEEEPETIWLVEIQTRANRVPISTVLVVYDNLYECSAALFIMGAANGVRIPPCVMGLRDWLGNISVAPHPEAIRQPREQGI